ncbi:MAG: class I SAM-dependent methyltransferase [Bacteroidota bacterium]
MPNEKQQVFWNSEGGDFWASEADRLDQFLEPVIPSILDPIKELPISHVLDIGCGPGALSLAAAKHFSNVTGIDLSNKLISMAWERTLSAGLPAQFVAGDAATFEPAFPFEALVSRFGVMFFDQPIEAFAALRARSTPGARLSVATWAPIEANPWIMETLEVVRPLLVEPFEALDPEAPGPFSMAHPNRVERLLSGAGWKNITINHWQNNLGMPEQTPEGAAAFFSGISPACRRAINQGTDPMELYVRLLEFYRAKLEKEGQINVQGAALLIQATA